MRVVAFIASFGAGLVLATYAHAASPAASSTGAATDKVATVGSRTITRGELETQVRAKLIEIDNQRYEALKDGLDEMIAE